jgi:hypothetical protein
VEVMRIIKERIQLAIQLLAIFKYLTSSQLVKLGVYKNRGDLTNALKKEVDQTSKPLIQKLDFGSIPGRGRLEDVYCLTKHGKDLLVNDLGYSTNQVKLPSRNSVHFKNDYDHRKATVDIHIGLYQWLEVNKGNKLYLDYYFDKRGNNRSSDPSKHVKSEIRIALKSGVSFEPDIATMFEIEGREYMVLFEQNFASTKKIYDQLINHAYAIAEGTVMLQYGLERSHRVVVLFGSESIKSATIKRLQANELFSHMNNFFLFKTNEEMRADFFHNWTLIDGSKIDLTQNISKQ